MPYPKQNVTDLLNAWGAGDKGAFDELVTVVYDELRRQASRFLQHESPGHTLQTTDLIHEAYLRLVDQKNPHWQNRAQFFGIAAQLMRRVLVDHARARHRAKRGGRNIRISFDEEVAAGRSNYVELIDIDEALNKLAGIDMQQSKIVELRFFGGLNVEETAQVLGISPRTVKRSWRFAKAWLRRELQDHDREHLSE
jgi:RNA polymerase sigma factor (TIGR02999 family)